MGTKQKTVYCCDKCGIEVDISHPFDEGEIVQEIYCSKCGSELINDFIAEGGTIRLTSRDNIEKYNNWCDRVTFYQAQKAKMRLGQCYMNALADVDKNMYNEYSCTKWDCFYEDKKCEAFIKKLMKDWGL